MAEFITQDNSVTVDVSEEEEDLDDHYID